MSDGSRFFRKDTHVCALCGGHVEDPVFALHEIIGRTAGGEDISAPLCTSCEGTALDDVTDAIKSAHAGRQLGRVPPLPAVPPSRMTVELLAAQTEEQQAE